MRNFDLVKFFFIKNQPSWPPRPQKEKYQTVLREVGVAPPHDNATPSFFRLQIAGYQGFHMRYCWFLY